MTPPPRLERRESESGAPPWKYGEMPSTYRRTSWCQRKRGLRVLTPTQSACGLELSRTTRRTSASLNSTGSPRRQSHEDVRHRLLRATGQAECAKRQAEKPMNGEDSPSWRVWCRGGKEKVAFPNDRSIPLHRRYAPCSIWHNLHAHA